MEYLDALTLGLMVSLLGNAGTIGLFVYNDKRVTGEIDSLNEDVAELQDQVAELSDRKADKIGSTLIS